MHHVKCEMKFFFSVRLNSSYRTQIRCKYEFIYKNFHTQCEHNELQTPFHITALLHIYEYYTLERALRKILNNVVLVNAQKSV